MGREGGWLLPAPCFVQHHTLHVTGPFPDNVLVISTLNNSCVRWMNVPVLLVRMQARLSWAGRCLPTASFGFQSGTYLVSLHTRLVGGGASIGCSIKDLACQAPPPFGLLLVLARLHLTRIPRR